jgi:hypothetical protein
VIDHFWMLAGRSIGVVNRSSQFICTGALDLMDQWVASR